MDILKLLSNLPGWRTKRKILVIESDDWGAIRMPSLKAYDTLKDKGVNVNKGDSERFNTLDTLASAKDLEVLFETLSAFKDKNGNHAIMTTMALSANPDFDKIEQHDFTTYYYQDIFQTLKDYQQEDAIPLWKKGFEEGMFVPEFHGREHLNVKLWMQALQHKDKDTLEAFRYKCWGFKPKQANMSYQAAFDVKDIEDISKHKEIITDGVRLFEKVHGRKPRFFVPPNGVIHQEVINKAVTEGMTYVSSPKIHHEPLGEGRHRKRFRYLGKKSKNGLLYITRNCFFEPSYRGRDHSLEDCLLHIHTAFKFHKPAVISSHRVNYIGGLKEKNRAEGNKDLKELLSQILKRWPKVEFMSSTELGELISHDKK